MAKQADGMPADGKGRKEKERKHTHSQCQGDTSTSKMAAARGGSNQETCCSFCGSGVATRCDTFPPPPRLPEWELLSERKTGVVNFSNKINVWRLKYE